MEEKNKTRSSIPVQISIDSHHKYLLKKMIAELTLENPSENYSVTSICKAIIDERLRKYQDEESDNDLKDLVA